MKKVLVFLLLVVIAFGFFLFFNNEEEVQTSETEPAEQKEEIRDILQEFVGTPYQEGPLGEEEGEEIYREDVFDCTTLVLTVAARRHAEDKTPEEKMKEIHYYPPGEVSYENRLHFSTYRNKVSDYFQDITKEIGGDLTQSREVVLNKYRQGEGRWINIDWQEEIVIDYIPRQRVSEVVDKLPEVAGVGFVREDLFSTGLDVTHEGFVVEGTNLIHASSEKGQVVEDNFLGYLANHNHSGVLFYEIK